jgi:gas vesicle protein
MNNNQKVLLGTLGATLAGVAIGLLIAPKNGAETRKIIREKATDLSDGARETLAKSKDGISNLSERLKSGFKQGVDTAMSRAETLVDEISGMSSNGRGIKS